MSPAAETAVSEEERGSRHALSWLLFDFISNITSSWLLYSQCLQVLNPSRLIVFLVSAAGTFDFFVSLKEFFLFPPKSLCSWESFARVDLKMLECLCLLLKWKGDLCVYLLVN